MDPKQIVEKTCRLTDPDLEKLLNLPSLDNQGLEKLNILLEIKKNAMKIEFLDTQIKEKQEMMEYSNRYPGYSMRYDNGMSNHYPPIPMRINDDGYSRDSVRNYLEMAMRNSRDDREREEIRQLMSHY